jgi:hypothetical protein
VRIPLGIAALAAICAAGPAHAVVLNLTSTPTATIIRNQTAYIGEVSFPTVTLFVGDSLTVNVDFGQTLTIPRLDRNSSGGVFNVRYGTTLDNGAVFFATPFGFPGSGTAFSGFSLTGTAIRSTQGVPIPDGFNLNRVTYQFEALPEPGMWAIMTLGFGGLGAMLRRHRARASAVIGAAAAQAG